MPGIACAVRSILRPSRSCAPNCARSATGWSPTRRLHAPDLHRLGRDRRPSGDQPDPRGAGPAHTHCQRPAPVETGVRDHRFDRSPQVRPSHRDLIVRAPAVYPSMRRPRLRTALACSMTRLLRACCDGVTPRQDSEGAARRRRPPGVGGHRGRRRVSGARNNSLGKNHSAAP